MATPTAKKIQTLKETETISPAKVHFRVFTRNRITSHALLANFCIGAGHECSQEGFFGDSENCNKFYRCVSNGQNGYNRYDFDCAQGTVWDQERQTCNFASAVENPTCRGGPNNPSNQGQGKFTPRSKWPTTIAANSSSSSYIQTQSFERHRFVE